jgi:hypothetical protein
MLIENINQNKVEVNNQEEQILKNFFDYLPKKPYCTDLIGEHGYLCIRSKTTAIQYPYIQPNPIHRTYWLVFDLDYPARKYWYDEDVPTPNLTVGNPVNEHQHLFYLLDPAIFTLQNARKKPLELAADVDRGLTHLLRADPAYGKQIAKNPTHTRWETHVWHEKEWTLAELIQWIPKKLLKQKRKPKEEIGLGRNCTVFEKVRVFAYSEWRRLKFYDDVRLFENVYDKALDFNNDFISPMRPQEVKSITRSVCKWTTKNLTREGFKDWGDARRQKSIQTRHTKSQTLAIEAKALYATGKTQAQIALILGVSQQQVSNLLRS